MSPATLRYRTRFRTPTPNFQVAYDWKLFLQVQSRDMPLHWRNLALYASQNFISDFQIPKPQRLCFGLHLWYLISLHFYLKLSVCLASIRIISPVSDCYFSVLLPLLTPSMLAFSRLPSLILLTCNVMHSPSKISSPLIKKELHLCP